jgi:hypothetical protein
MLPPTCDFTRSEIVTNARVPVILKVNNDRRTDKNLMTTTLTLSAQRPGIELNSLKNECFYGTCLLKLSACMAQVQGPVVLRRTWGRPTGGLPRASLLTTFHIIHLIPHSHLRSALSSYAPISHGLNIEMLRHTRHPGVSREH